MVHVYCHLKVRYSFPSRFCNTAFRLSVASESQYFAGGAGLLLHVADRTDCPFFYTTNSTPPGDPLKPTDGF